MSSRSGKSSARADHNSPLKRRLWGRRIGRPLGKDRLESLEKFLPRVAVPKEKITATGNIDPASLFEKPFADFWFEIGFGNGDHLIALKDNYADVGFLGAEPFVNGVSALLKNLEDRPVDNIRIHMDDALPLIRSLQNASLGRIYILNPDPWPKARHHKRRIINQANLDEFFRVLKPGGRLVMATDVDDLAEWMVTRCMGHHGFVWDIVDSRGWKTPPTEWIETRFAFKGRQAGRRQTFLTFKKLANPAK